MAMNSAMREYAAHTVKYLKVQGIRDAQGVVKTINQQIDRDFALAGPLTLSTPSERVHAVRWAAIREAFVVETHVTRAAKEIIAAVVAQINTCPFCVDAHGTSLSATGDDTTAKAIVSGTWKNLEDEKTKALIEWGLNTRNPNASIIQNPPFSEREAPEIIGTALTFHSINRLVNIFLAESPLPGILGSKPLKKIVLRLASKTMIKSIVRKKADASDALQFIERHAVQGHLHWAQAVPAYATVLAAEEFLLTEIERDLIPAVSGRLLKEKVSRWQGEDLPMGKAWLSGMLKDIDEKEKPIAKMMFLAVFAPYTVTEEDIQEFREVNSSDKDLVEICFWATQIVTNRIGQWLVQPLH